MTGRPFPPVLAAAVALSQGLGAGCAPPETPTAAPVEAAPVQEERQPADADPSVATTHQAEEVRAHSLEILQAVSDARALKIRGEMKVDIISRDGIREFARSTMYEHITPEQFELLTRIESSFGVLPDGADGEQIILDMLEQGVLGLYDPKRKTLFVGDFVSKTMLSQVVGHEIAHGLQDMHFDLEAMQKPIFHESDAESARTFLVEGDAQASYFSWVSGSDGLRAISDDVLDAMGRQALDLADALPHPILARQLQLPYTDGAATVTRLAREKGWEAVDALYGRLPESTEQMLHLDKLLARELPLDVQLDREKIGEALPGLEVIWDDTLGEGAILTMLADVESSRKARAHADGWGGGRYLVYDRTDEPLATPVIAGAVAWDSKQDAAEFEEAFTRYIEERPAANAPSMQRFVLDRDGTVVTFALRIPADVAPRTLEKALGRAVKVTRPKKGKNG